jgi:hypothetical protein
MFVRRASLAAVTALSVQATAVSAATQELPPLPATLLNASGAVCIDISKIGKVDGAYVLASTGDAQTDNDMLAWVKQMRWPIARPGEKLRDAWFPMPTGFGAKQPPTVAPTCAAPPVERSANAQKQT